MNQNLKLSNNESNTVRFSAKKFVIGSDYLCMDFEQPLLINFERINKLIFEWDGKKFEFKKVIE